LTDDIIRKPFGTRRRCLPSTTYRDAVVQVLEVCGSVVEKPHVRSLLVTDAFFTLTFLDQVLNRSTIGSASLKPLLVECFSSEYAGHSSLHPILLF